MDTCEQEFLKRNCANVFAIHLNLCLYQLKKIVQKIHVTVIFITQHLPALS